MYCTQITKRSITRTVSWLQLPLSWQVNIGNGEKQTEFRVVQTVSKFTEKKLKHIKMKCSGTDCWTVQTSTGNSRKVSQNFDRPGSLRWQPTHARTWRCERWRRSFVVWGRRHRTTGVVSCRHRCHVHCRQFMAVNMACVLLCGYQNIGHDNALSLVNRKLVGM